MEEAGGGLGGQRRQVRGKPALPGEEKTDQIGAFPLGENICKGYGLHRFHAVLPAADGDEFCRRGLDPQPDRGHGGAVRGGHGQLGWLVQGHDQRPLGAQLVKTPPLGAARIGPQGFARFAAPGGVDVAQSGVVRFGIFQGFGIDGGVAPRGPHLPVDAQQVKPPVQAGGEAGKRVVLPVGGCKGAAVYGAVELRELNRLQIRLCKNMYVVRPGNGGVGRFCVEIVVVAGGDEHRDRHLLQGLGQ